MGWRRAFARRPTRMAKFGSHFGNIGGILVAAIVGILVVVVSIIVAFLGANLALGTIATQTPQYFGNVKNVTAAYSNADVGNTQANSLLHSIAPVLPLALVVFTIGAVLGIGVLFAIKYKNPGGT